MKNKPTTKGWKIEGDWKNGTSSWCSLSDIKESSPVQMADYAINHAGLKEESAFVWWARYVSRKRNRILKASKNPKSNKEQQILGENSQVWSGNPAYY